MKKSKEWNWNEVKDTKFLMPWITPCEESYFLIEDWRKKNFKKFLDLGCGLGRHSILFSKNGFDVSAFDLSAEGIDYLNEWSKHEKVNVDTKVGDMLNLPYETNYFDCLLAYNVISHTDTVGIKRIISEIERVLKKDGEFYLTLCSKDTWSFKKANFPKLDENTIIKTEDGPEKGVPHFYVGLEDIFDLFINFEIISIRHIDNCYSDGVKRNSKHYFVFGKK